MSTIETATADHHSGAADPVAPEQDADPAAAPPRRRRLPVAPMVASLLFIGLGLFWLFGYGPLILHKQQWTTGGDLWGIFRAAHYVGWGWFGGIYDQTTGVVTFPGIFVLLAPVAMFSGWLGLSESFTPYFAAHPTAALLLQPVELLMAVPVIFAVDSLAQALAVGRRARWVLDMAVALVAVPVVSVWGHAEDVLAVALALFAVRQLFRDRYRSGGWLLGAAIVVQPLAGMAAPLLLAVSRRGERLKLAARAVVPSAVLISIALAGNWSDAVRALVKQPTPPAVNHATPWVRFSPHLNSAKAHAYVAQRLLEIGKHFYRQTYVVHPGDVLEVSGGPVRTVGVLLAVVIGVVAWRKRPDPVGVIWLLALALSLRCYFEPVMTPYYLAAPLIVALIAASRRGWWRFGVAMVATAAVSLYAYHRTSPWAWWLPVVILLTVVLVCGYPGRAHLAGGAGPDAEGAGGAGDAPDDESRADDDPDPLGDPLEDSPSDGTSSELVSTA